MAIPQDSMGDVVDHFLSQQRQISSPENSLPSHKFHQWQVFMSRKSQILIDCLSTFSTSQLTSLWVLWPLTEQRLLVVQSQDSPDADPVTTVQSFLLSLKPLVEAVYPPFMHDAMVELLQFEFSRLPESFYPSSDFFVERLHEARRRACRFAVCHDLSQSDLSARDLTETPVRAASPPWQRQILKTSGIVPPLAILAKQGNGPYFEHCAWLSALDKRENVLPFWLWDRELKRTVQTQTVLNSLSQSLDYVAISHTWGRWKKDEPWIAVEGVPWKFPQNTRFDVDQLPDLLAKVPYGTRYVWFDLVCIYQVPFTTKDFDLMKGELDLELIEIFRLEIARQASIFQMAKGVLAWFSDVLT